MMRVPWQLASPGQLMIGVLSPKFHAKLVMVVPCVVVVDEASNTMVSCAIGFDGENVKFALGPGGAPTGELACRPTSADWPVSSVTVNWTIVGPGSHKRVAGP